MTNRFPCLIRFSLVLGTMLIVQSSATRAQQSPVMNTQLSAQQQSAVNTHFMSLWCNGLFDMMTPQTVQEALKAGAEVNIKRNDGETALITVARFENEQSIGNGAHGAASIYSDILSEMASEHQARSTVIKMLLDAGANANLRGAHGETALIVASAPPFPSELLDESLGWSDSDANRFHTALLAEADAGDDRVIQLLLDHGADVNAQSEGGKTALISAASAGNVSIAEILLQHGANINAKDKQGRTALMWAVQSETNSRKWYSDQALEHYSKLIALLLQKGADVNTKDNSGVSPLHVAASALDLPLIMVLQAAGAK